MVVVSRSPIIYSCRVKSYQGVVPEFYFTDLLIVNYLGLSCRNESQAGIILGQSGAAS